MFYFSNNNTTVAYRWVNANKNFDLPLALENDKTSMKIIPSTKWKTLSLKDNEAALFDVTAIEKKYYITVKQTK